MSQNEKSAAPSIPAPDWFRLELDAERVARQLGGLKELSFYLKNPNPYIRRIALLRVGALVPKDSADALTKILEDSLETEENKRIAAWALNRTIKRHGIQWFLHHPLLQEYTGLEDISIFGAVEVAELESEIRLDLSAGIADLPDINDPTFLKTQMDDQDFRVEFSMADWLKESSGLILHDLAAGFGKLGRRLVGELLPLIGRHLLGFVALLFVTLPKRLFALIGRAIRASRERRLEARTARKAERAAAAVPVEPQAPATASAFQTQTGIHSQTVIPSQTVILPETVIPSQTVIPPETVIPSQAVIASQTVIPPETLIPSQTVIASQTVLPPETVIPSQTVIPSAGAASQPTSGQTVRQPAGAAVLPSHADILAMQSRLAMQDDRTRDRFGRRRRYGSRSSGWKVKDMFQMIFYPVRLMRRHWIFTAFVVLCAYLLLTFTRHGHGFFERLNPGISGLNDRFVSSARLWFLDAFDVDEAAASASQAPTETTASAAAGETSAVQAEPLQYRVTATKGLNLREAPDMSAARVVFMPPGTVVTAEGETATGSDALTWMKVRTGEGKTGWAAAKWLTESKEE